MKKIFLYSLGSLLPLLASADAFNYKLASPLPGDKQQVRDFLDYAIYFFPFMLSVAGVAAFTMFVFGGIQYMASAGNPAQVSDAKDRMTKAILGLLLAVFSVVILRTINPELVKLKLDLRHVGDGPSTPRGSACGGNYFGDCPSGQDCIADDNINYACRAPRADELVACPDGCDCSEATCTQQQKNECRNAGAFYKCVVCNPGGRRSVTCSRTP